MRKSRMVKIESMRELNQVYSRIGKLQKLAMQCMVAGNPRLLQSKVVEISTHLAKIELWLDSSAVMSAGDLSRVKGRLSQIASDLGECQRRGFDILRIGDLSSFVKLFGVTAGDGEPGLIGLFDGVIVDILDGTGKPASKKPKLVRPSSCPA